MKLSVHQTADMLDLLIRSNGDRAQAAQIARNHGLITRAAGTDSGDLAADFDHAMAGLFFSSGEHFSAFDAIKQAARPATLRETLFTSAAPIVAQIIGEGVKIPTARFSLNGEQLEPVKAAGFAAMTKEAARTPQGRERMTLELQEATGIAVDTKFFADMATAAGFTQAATASPTADIKAALDAVNLRGAGRLFVATSPSIANNLCTTRYFSENGLVFPDAGPVGGSVCGMPLLVTAGLTDSMMILDANALAIAADETRFSITENAMVDLGDTTLVSLFQIDGLGVLAIRSFSYALMRASGVAVISSVAWE